MRQLRILIVIFAVLSFVGYGAYRYYEYRDTDNDAPVITADADRIEVSVETPDSELLAGLSASDNVDGDVTDSLVLVSKSKFIEAGVRKLSYAAFDSHDNVGTYSREMVYTDYIPPHYSVKEPLRFLSGNSGYEYLEYISAQDCLDGDLSAQIKVTAGTRQVADETHSEQPIYLQVTNSAGDTAALELTASFEDYATYSAPSPALSDYLVYVKVGEEVDYRSLLTGVWSAGKVRSFEKLEVNPDADVVFNAQAVDYSTPGIYPVVYRLMETGINGLRIAVGTATLYVIVEAA